jgi:hypothetical protein
MAKFKIIQTEDPSPYKKQIIAFWDEYLTDTPHERFEWMMQGNPDGPTTWFLAVTEDTNELIGTINIMPRDVIQNNTIIRSGFLGDYIVDKNHRVFGPGLKLPKVVAQSCTNLGYNLIFAIPNSEAVKVLQRAGLKGVKELCCYVKPIKLAHYFEKYIPSLFSQLLSPLVEIGLSVYYKEFFTSSKYISDEVNQINDSFNRLWDKIKKCSTNKLGNHGLTYIKWRFLQNPLYRFKILVAREKGKEDLVGYIIFSINRNKLEIFDTLFLKEEVFIVLLKKVSLIARKDKCQGIYFTVPLKSKWPAKLKTHGFIDAKSSMKLCWLADKGISIDDWDFLQGDRNI